MRTFTSLMLAAAVGACGVDGKLEGSDAPSGAGAGAPGLDEGEPDAVLPDAVDDPGRPSPEPPSVAPFEAGDEERAGRAYGFTDDAEYDDDRFRAFGHGDLNGCGAPHRMIGWTAELKEIAHHVGGTAEIIDGCTIEIRDFTYDGKGGPTQIFGGRDGNWFDGFAMTDLLSKKGYDGQTVIAKLPTGVRLDDLDGVSVWCIEQDADFGNGTFAPPPAQLQ